jgi:AraC-like DNA-binding protein
MSDNFKHAARIDLFADALDLPGLMHFGRYRHTAAGHGLNRHVHAGGLEICYLARGKQAYRVGGQEYLLSGGDCYWVGPDQPHDSAGKPQEKGVLYWMVLDCSCARSGLLNLRGADAAELRKALLSMPTRQFRLGSRGRELLDAFLDRVSAPAGPMRRIRAGHVLLEFLLRMLDAANAPGRREPSAPIRRAIAMIETDPAADLSVADLASEAHLSLSRFKARFREEMGVPPAEYMLRARVARSRELLADDGRSITDVALDLGFSSSQYFATVFRRFMHQTPSEYRRESRSR